MSYNNECSICIEEFDDKHNINLSCNHMFHSKCIMKYVETEFNKFRKNGIGEHMCCKRIKCPLCRKAISCKDINPLIYNYYQLYKEKYKHIKKKIKRLQNEIYTLNIKFQMKKLFYKIKPQDAYKHLLEDETLLETMMIYKQKYQETKELMNSYKQIYYGRCSYCIYPRSSLYFSDI